MFSDALTVTRPKVLVQICFCDCIRDTGSSWTAFSPNFRISVGAGLDASGANSNGLRASARERSRAASAHMHQNGWEKSGSVPTHSGREASAEESL